MQNPINRFITFLSITVLFTFIGIFVATQQVAYHCEYDSALDKGFKLQIILFYINHGCLLSGIYTLQI